MPDEKSIDEDTAIAEDKAIAEISVRLHERFPHASDEEITSAIEWARESFHDSKVRDFVPVLIEKQAKARLKGKR